MTGPRKPLLDATITQVGTEESYTVAPTTAETVKVLRLLANAVEAGRVGLKHRTIGPTLKRECKFNDLGDLQSVELALHVYLVTDPDFVIGGVTLTPAPEAFNPEIKCASATGVLPTR